MTVCWSQAALRTVTANILEQPDELRFRSLRCSNSTLAGKVLPVPGARQLLLAIGFQPAEPGSSGLNARGYLRLPTAAVDAALLRRAVDGLDRLLEVPASAPAPAGVVDLPEGQAAAGTPFALRNWDSRFRQPENGRVRSLHGCCDADAASASDAAPLALRDLFARPTLEEFLREHKGVRPVVISLASEWLAQPSGKRWPPSVADSGGEDEPGWVQRAAQLAAAAASLSAAESRGNGGSVLAKNKRLVVVNPDDVERRAADPMVEQAMAQADNGGLTDAFRDLTQRRLVAVRDVHTDEATVSLLREAFATALDCPVTTNLYMNGVGSAGFVEHHDMHDVFAIQLHGVKRWSVGPPTVRHPSHRYRWRDEHRSPDEVMQEYVTRAGEAVYIPLGWRHYAVPQDDAEAGAEEGGEGGRSLGTAERSVHVTIGVQLPRWGDLMEGVLHELGAGGETCWLREPLPASVTDLAGRVDRPLEQKEGGGGGAAVKYGVGLSELRERLTGLAEAVGRLEKQQQLQVQQQQETAEVEYKQSPPRLDLQGCF